MTCKCGKEMEEVGTAPGGIFQRWCPACGRMFSRSMNPSLPGEQWSEPAWIKTKDDFDPELWKKIKDKEWGPAVKDLYLGFKEQGETIVALKEELAELRKNDGELFCKIMVEAIAGLADAVIVKQAQYSGFHSLKYVKMLREKVERLEEENKKLLDDFMHISRMFTEALKLCHRVMKIERGDDDADKEGS